MLRGEPAERRDPMSSRFGHHHPAATMSLDRLVVRDPDANGSGNPPRLMTAPIPTASPNPTPNPGAPPMSRKLPPLIRDNSFPGAGQGGVMTARSMHQIQLEMEYDAAESDHEDGKGPSIHSWPGGLERHASTATPEGEDNPGAREVDALCIFDTINLPQTAQPSSPLIDALHHHPSVRRWGRWRWRSLPSFTSVHVGEAVMMYERGLERTTADRCSRCRAGQGVSPHCVVAPDRVRRLQELESGPCSNCVYDGVGYACNVSGRNTPLSGRGDRAADAAARRNPDPGIDHLAVLEMIAQLKTQSGSRRDLSIRARAARIETAAMRIAQAAREWGEKMAHEA